MWNLYAYRLYVAEKKQLASCHAHWMKKFLFEPRLKNAEYCNVW
jgi:hypothetical protein